MRFLQDVHSHWSDWFGCQRRGYSFKLVFIGVNWALAAPSNKIHVYKMRKIESNIFDCIKEVYEYSIFCHFAIGVSNPV
jgi:hypothetical protein